MFVLCCEGIGFLLLFFLVAEIKNTSRKCKKKMKRTIQKLQLIQTQRLKWTEAEALLCETGCLSNQELVCFVKATPHPTLCPPSGHPSRSRTQLVTLSKWFPHAGFPLKLLRFCLPTTRTFFTWIKCEPGGEQFACPYTYGSDFTRMGRLTTNYTPRFSSA